jgi:hypothetical protein
MADDIIGEIHGRRTSSRRFFARSFIAISHAPGGCHTSTQFPFVDVPRRLILVAHIGGMRFRHKFCPTKKTNLAPTVRWQSARFSQGNVTEI